MDQLATLVILPNLMASALTAWVAYKVITGRRTEHRAAMAACFSFISLNSLVLLAEKLVGDMGLALSIVAMEYVLESLILVSLLVFVMQYIGLGRFVTRRNVVLFASPAIAVLLFNLTNGSHSLFYERVEIVQSHGFYMFEAEYGPLFLIWIGYFISVILLVNVLLARAMVETPPERRTGLGTLTLATLTMLTASILYVLSSRSDPTVDILSIGFSLSALLVFLGERRSDFVNLDIVRFREAIAGMDDAVMILDSSLQVIYANPPARRILNQNADYVNQRNKARGLKVPVGSHKWETAMVLDGQPRHFVVSTSDIFRDDRPVGAVFTFHDISDRKCMEKGLRRTNRGMTVLNQILTHDIRNDVTAIGGYLELLEGTGIDDRQRHLIEKIKERARSAEGHLQFASSQRESQMGTMMWQDLQTVIQKALAKVDMKGIDVELRIEGVQLLADPMLENVFHVLADNTARHGAKATRVRVRGENIETGMSMIWEDDGVGVPEERKQLIFEKGVGDNTGLGLYLARDILANTGFTITEEGEPGKGARFVIRVPSGWFTWTRPSN